MLRPPRNNVPPAAASLSEPVAPYAPEQVPGNEPTGVAEPRLEEQQTIPLAPSLLERGNPLPEDRWLSPLGVSRPAPRAAVVAASVNKGAGRRAMRIVVCAALMALLVAGSLLIQQRRSSGGTRVSQQSNETLARRATQQHYSLPTLPTATPMPAAPTATPLPPLPDFAVIPPFCNADLLGNTPAPGTPTPAGCVTCPYVYDPTQYSIAQVQAALQQAAALYQLPPLLVEAISWEESGWVNTGLITCQYDSGLFGLKQGYWQYFDELSLSSCGLSYDTYNPTTLVGNADMGAKLIKFLYCYYGWAGDSGGSEANPGMNTNAWYFQQAGLAWPDFTLPSGQANPTSLCEATRTDPASAVVHSGSNYPGTYTFAQIYGQILPPTEPWGCPFTATSGDHTVYELAIAAYQAGTGTIDTQPPCPTPEAGTPIDADAQCPLTNQWYINDISTHLVKLSEGVTPT